MSNTFYSTELSALFPQAGSGVNKGGGAQTRSTALGAHLQGVIASFTTPVGIANGDVVNLALMDVESKMFSAQILFDALGAGRTISLGKVNMNNASLSDPTHYVNAVDASAPGNIDATLNLGEQFGADPSGDVTEAFNSQPLFGHGSVIITLTFGGGAPLAGANIVVLITYMSGT
jgi:hypothetical protein